MTQGELVRVTDLKKYFTSGSKLMRNLESVKAVDGVSFSIARGETFGLVGESGCGKSTVARTVIRLYEPDGGEIRLGGADISHLRERELAPYRVRMQMIFQDPYASLNPRMDVKRIVQEPLLAAGLCPRQEAAERAAQLIELVGLHRSHLGKYPHEFSGGQRQRIGIARALITNPEFVLCDEPISALDVSIQAQVVNMLRDLQQKLGLTYLFIAHDLAMVRYISSRMGVMYLGRLVETAPSAEIYRHPLHPYTQGLISAIPLADPDKAARKKEIALEGEIPSPLNPPSGCRFHTRCPKAIPRCREEAPALREVGPDHMAACHLI